MHSYIEIPSLTVSMYVKAAIDFLSSPSSPPPPFPLLPPVESPAGVGFSYSTNPQVDYIINDNQTALDNYNFLVNFFANYSEYKANDFYVT